MTIGQMTRYEIGQVYRPETILLADAGARSLWYTGHSVSKLDRTHGGAQAPQGLRLWKEG
jgi:hypothetical protein